MNSELHRNRQPDDHREPGPTRIYGDDSVAGKISLTEFGVYVQPPNPAIV